MKNKKPRILLFDLETSPLTVHTWGTKDQNIGLNQIVEDSNIIAWAAKWLGEKKVFYKDLSKAKNKRDDKQILPALWHLIDQADILISQNGVSFDLKVANARFILNDMPPPSPCKHIDTLRISRKNFRFTSHKLEYMTKKLVPESAKSEHKNFPGQNLWTECLAGNPKAWAEMKDYNIQDVVSLEKLYHKFQPWDNTIDFNLFMDSDEVICNCGSEDFHKRGHSVTSGGKYQRLQCQDCGKWTRSKENLLSKEKRSTLKVRA